MSKRGFTLIELMMTVAIAGILAAIMIPSFKNFTCRTRVTEAKITLRAIYSYQETYRSEHDYYVGGPFAQQAIFDPIFRSMPTRRYAYSVTAAGTTFTGLADGEAQMSGDTWTIDQEMSLNWVSHHADCE